MDYFIEKSLVFLILFLNSAFAQVFIPFSMWSGTAANLVISNAVTYNYGSLNISTPTDKTFTVSNTGSFMANSMVVGTFSNPSVYTFKGGSYPGTGGTCLSALGQGSSCTIVVTANGATIGVVNDTIALSYRNRSNSSSAAIRPITTTFINTATQLAWISTALFMKINDCNAVTVQRQDSAGNPMTTASSTPITGLLFNSGTGGTYYSDSGCTATITTTTIAASTNSITFYFKNTTSGQTGILLATAAGLTSASQNVTITATPTKLFANPAPTVKTNTCAAFTINTVDVNNYNSNAGSTVTVNLSTSGANIYYSDSGCTASITSTTIASGTFTRTLYTQNATLQTATITATDNAAVLTASSKSVNFNSSLTWWNGSWTKRVRIDINNSDQAASLTNQTVLVKIDSAILNYSDVQANGADIRFIASDDTTLLNYEFDNWSYNSTSEIWVRVPSIAASSSAGYIYLYYKNPAASDAQNRSGVWTNFWSVWHLGEDPASTAPQYIDSTGSGRNGTATNSPVRIIGKIGYAIDLNGATDAVDINSDLSVALGVSATFSCWMRTSQIGNNTSYNAPGLTGVEQNGGANDIFFGWIDASGFIGITAGNGANAKSSFIVNNNAWRHVTITRNSASGAVVFYINGVQSGTATSETGSKTTYFDLLGEIGNSGGTPVNYNGLLDEVRIYNSLQSAAQVQADFKFMMNTNLIYGFIESGP